ncbi:hypothetical protein [Desertivirga arenae]|uniref:hypothetical protein n=1 Tax=Desertivirga arenae TaxID=2810309 RepID=UPI001A96EAC7|nr:hypothetical protein [Pedobacter sp. SYSU D00823]
MKGRCQHVNPKREIKREAQKLIVYDDNFVHRVLTNAFQYHKLRKAYSRNKLSRIADSNPGLKERKHYYLSFYKGTDNFKFYDNGNNIFPVSINLHTSDLTLEGNLKVGLGKRLFGEQYKLHNIPDLVQFSDIEQGNLFTFVFKNDVLSSINFSVCYLD